MIIFTEKEKSILESYPILEDKNPLEIRDFLVRTGLPTRSINKIICAILLLRGETEKFLLEIYQFGGDEVRYRLVVRLSNNLETTVLGTYFLITLEEFKKKVAKIPGGPTEVQVYFLGFIKKSMFSSDLDLGFKKIVLRILNRLDPDSQIDIEL